MTERSTSRGRDALSSSGRGGMGNIRASLSQDRPLSGPDDFSDTRGREPVVAAVSELSSTGRGGAGNFRSPSRDPVEDRDVRSAAERQVIQAHEAREREAVHSSGRGGLGNMSRSRSRGPGSPLASPSPTRTPSVGPGPGLVHSSGRGGAGNITPGPPPAYERGRAAALDGVHSTGRGGLANLTAAPAPPPDAVVHHPGTYESTGRGGAGNISRSRERTSAETSRERGASRDRGEKGGIAGLWGRLHPHAHPATIQEGGQSVGADGVPAVVGPGGPAGAVGGGGRGAI
ncbi:hypothetical protein B0H17DRAFT_1091029 [Mycena rosella]|uniref:Uncharacterized protein n=1 Tax=Mycena rosella TaxID=1033263 RepID=A0AAD7G3Z6_MYCRO|nr:hypothetical protein B0H17DRAFT_1091029 [Mycena rosella]